MFDVDLLPENDLTQQSASVEVNAGAGSILKGEAHQLSDGIKNFNRELLKMREF